MTVETRSPAPVRARATSARGLARVLVVGACAAGLLGILALSVLVVVAPRTAAGELVANVRFPLGLAAAAAALPLAALRRVRLALAGAVLALVHVTPELTLCFGGPPRSEASVLPTTRTASASAPDAPPRAAATGAELRVVAANLQYGQADPERLWQCLGAYDADLVMLAEVCEPNRAGTSWTALAEQWRERYPYQHAGPGTAFHILLLSRFPLESTQDHALEPPVARPGVPWTQRRALVEADVRLPERTVKVFAAHFPIPYGGWSLAARAQLVDRIARERDGSPLIVLGDLNATSTSALFADLCARAGVRDSRRGFGPCFSWTQGVPWRVIAIDHVLVSDEIAVLHRGVGPELGSDHLPALAALSVALPGAAVRPTTGAASDRSRASSAPR